MEEINDMKAI
jgi:uncharacterized membrane protein (DUF106 family)